MEKVKVNKEIFDALESFVNRGKNLKTDLNYDVCTNYDLKPNELILRRLSCATLVDIAYCGYESEETKEEKLLKFYRQCIHLNNENPNDRINLGKFIGIIETLNLLGIEIDYINK